MNRIKTFEAFTLPGRNPKELIETILSDLTDEFGGAIEIYVYKDEVGWPPRNINAMITIKEVLRRSEIEKVCDEYLIPACGRISDEGFDFIPQKAGIIDMYGVFTKKAEMWYEGIHIRLVDMDTIFYLKFKSELK